MLKKYWKVFFESSFRKIYSFFQDLDIKLNHSWYKYRKFIGFRCQFDTEERKKLKKIDRYPKNGISKIMKRISATEQIIHRKVCYPREKLKFGT